MFGRLRAVCFDLDNTFWDVEPVIARAEAELQAWLAEHYPEIPRRFSIEAMRAHRAEMMRARPEIAHDLTYIRTESLALQAEAAGYTRDLASHGFEVFYRARHRVELFADVTPSIAALSKRFVLATLSNGNADLARIGIRDWFAVSLSAGEIGFAKPHAMAFHTVCDRLGVSPEQVLYVGDDPHFDVAGARSAGMPTAWVNRRAHVWPDNVVAADCVVRDLAELSAVLTVA
jgi:FMN hydrolase / 5-amino-6-(5-phospho-D-ribitylamino)uracil phosphatase